MRHITAFTTMGALALFTATAAFAAGAPGHGSPHTTTVITTTAGKPTSTGPSFTGQPNQSCGSVTAPSTPGMSAAAPGSAFNPDGTSGGVYAGQQPQNSFNSASVSQYDVACFRQP